MAGKKNKTGKGGKKGKKQKSKIKKKKVTKNKKTPTKKKQITNSTRKIPTISLATLRNYPIIEKIAKGKKLNIKKLPNSGINAICECLYNALWSDHLSKKSIYKLEHLPESTKKDIRFLAETPKSKKLNKKKKLIKQHGGSIGAVIATVLPTLLELLFPRKR